MGKKIGRFCKNNRSKLSNPTLKKPVLSSSASHTLSAINLTQASISYRLVNKHIATNQNKNNISSTDVIQSCVTLRKKYGVQAKYMPTHLTPLNITLPIASVKLHTTTKYPLYGK